MDTVSLETVVEDICTKSNCRNDCQARHPILCKYGKNCKFSKRGICAYKHTTDVEENDALENKIKILQNENMNLRNKIKVGEKALNEEISKTDQLKLEINDLERSLKMKVEMLNTIEKQMEEKDSIIEYLEQRNGDRFIFESPTVARKF